MLRHRSASALASGGMSGLLGGLLDRPLLAAGFAAAAASPAAAAPGSGQHTAAQDVPSSTLSASAAETEFRGLQAASNGTSSSYRPVVTGSVLKRHGRDLTLEATEGRLDPLIGRHDVVERALQVLLRRTKNNPVLIGDPGVGKTAVAEGIAQLIASPAAPPGLAGRALISLDVGSLVAGTQYRGAFEERLTSLLNEVRMAAGRVLLFIDEMHILMDAGRVEGGMNAANLLKPALARGDLHCIGATTVEEYRRHIEQDGAFARRFQPIMVEEPTPEEALLWMKGLRGRYERYHGVRFTDAALETAVRAAQRYIPNRRLPDSAIDVIDEAAARARLHKAAASRAAAVAAVAAAQRTAAAAAAAAGGAAGQHGDPPAEAALGSSEELRRMNEWLTAAPQAQAQAQGQGQSPQQALHQQLGAAMAAGGVQVAAGGTGLSASAVHTLSCPHCGTPTVPPADSVTVTCARCAFTFLSIPQDKLLLGASLFPTSLQQQQQQQQLAGQPVFASASPFAAAAAATDPQLAAAGAAAAQPAAAAAAAAELAPAPGPPVVDSADVLLVIAEASGIPAEHISQSDWQPLAELEPRLRRRVAGQEAAVAAVVGAVRLGRLGLQRGGRPLASLLLTGPAGVGKATLCQALAESLFGSDRHLLRFNLAEFSDRASVSRLVGAPPGYVGYGDGGLLTEAVRRRPHSVVLLERVDRAHPEVLSLVTQVLESGQLADSMGKRCDFRNALLVLTTSPTTAPLTTEAGAVPVAATPAAAGAAVGAAGEAAAGSAGSAGVQPGATVSVEVAEAHMHPEAYAGDVGGGGHGAHSAAAQCMQVEDEQPQQAQQQQQQQQQQGQQQHAGGPVHPLRLVPAELLSRLDAAVSMQPLSHADMVRIVELQLAEVQQALLAQGISLQVDPAAQHWLATHGLSPVSGAQRLQALLRGQLLLPVADALLRQRVQQQQQQQQQHPAEGAAAGGSVQVIALARLAADGSRLEVRIEE